MNVHHVSSAGAAGFDIPLLAVPVFETEEGADPALPADLVDVASGPYLSEDLKGKLGEFVVAYMSGDGGPRRLLLLGAGKASELDCEAVRRWAGHAVRAAESIGVVGVGAYLGGMELTGAEHAGQAAAEGAVLAAWRFTEMKGASDGDDPTEVSDFTVMADPQDLEEAGRGAEIGHIIGRAANFTRTLQSRPGNVATPTHLGDEASRMAGERGLDVTVMILPPRGDALWTLQGRLWLNPSKDVEVRVALVQGENVLGATTTGDGGRFKFQDLIVGEWTLEFHLGDEEVVVLQGPSA